ncbi:MAG: hypothetical protein DMF03_01850 [Verrucomicrobia bacterium]|nr:MAG: hypothetical protein DMF03_01850 [Verrucomicrobiota bacterium]
MTLPVQLGLARARRWTVPTRGFRLLLRPLYPLSQRTLKAALSGFVSAANDGGSYNACVLERALSPAQKLR